MKSYYKPRWEMWRDRIDDPTLHEDIVEFERNWAERTLGTEPELRGDAFENALKILTILP